MFQFNCSIWTRFCFSKNPSRWQQNKEHLSIKTTFIDILLICFLIDVYIYILLVIYYSSFSQLHLIWRMFLLAVSYCRCLTYILFMLAVSYCRCLTYILFMLAVSYCRCLTYILFMLAVSYCRYLTYILFMLAVSYCICLTYILFMLLLRIPWLVGETC